MSSERADVKAINPLERQTILAELGLASKQPLAVGTEAEVYELNAHTLLKIYAGAKRVSYLQTLQQLYEQVDAAESSLHLPQILKIIPHHDTVAVLETRLEGVPLEAVLDSLQGQDLERAEELYFETACSLKKIKLKFEPSRYLLFDEEHKSEASTQSFEDFYASSLQNKLESVAQFFQSLDKTFEDRALALVKAIRQQPGCTLSLVHGDLFPGNIVVNRRVERVEGVIDFGSFSLFGNYLLDVAGAFGFYKMYHPQRKAIRSAVLSKVLNMLPETEHPLFFQFLLANAILTSDLYATEPDPRSDGHFRWAAEIAGEQNYWDRAL